MVFYFIAEIGPTKLEANLTKREDRPIKSEVGSTKREVSLMKRWIRYILAAALSLALVFTMTPLLGDSVFADCDEPGTESPGSEAACQSEPTDRVITPDMIPSSKSGPKAPKAAGSIVSTKGKKIPLLVIVIGFSNVSYDDYKQYDWSKLLYDPDNSRNLLEYYNDMSYSQFTFEPIRENSRYNYDGNTNKYDKIDDGIIHVKLDMPHYRWLLNKSTEDDKAKGKAMVRAFAYAIEEAKKYLNSDFVNYDKNGNNRLDEEELATVFIVGGYDSGVSDSQEKQDTDYYMRAHKSTLASGYAKYSVPYAERYYPKITGGGKSISLEPYVAISENCERSTGIINGRISSLAHELGHHLGLPDLYDTSSTSTKPWSNYQVGNLSLMASGSWVKNASGVYSPVSFDPWSKTEMGWIEPQEMTSSTQYTASAQNYYTREENNILKVPAKSIDPSKASGEEEYYLIEARRANKWDEGLASLNDSKWKTRDGDGGLIFWHIDDKVLKSDIASSGMYQRVNTPDHRPGVMPLYLESNYTTWISRENIAETDAPIDVETDTPFFDKYNWENNKNSLNLDDTDAISLPKYGNVPINYANRSYSGANVQILSDADRDMNIAFWDSSHTHDFNYQYEKYSEGYCENGGYRYECEDCIDCGMTRCTATYYVSKAPGHQWIKEDIEEPDYGRKGESFWYCDRCGESKYVDIPALPLSDKKGKDGTRLGEGASKEAAHKVLSAYKKETDPAGSKFSKLKLRTAKLAKRSIQIAWNRAGATKYVIYGSKCGKTRKLRRLKTTTSRAVTFKKIAGTRMKAKTYYKFVVVALDKNGDVVSTSKMIHVATKGSKYKSNHTSVYVSKKIRTKAKNLKKGKTLALKAKAKKKSGYRVVKHVGLRYQSSNKKIVTVSSKGTIKGIKKGKAKVWAYAQDGVYRTIYVTVK